MYDHGLKFKSSNITKLKQLCLNVSDKKLIHCVRLNCK